MPKVTMAHPTKGIQIEAEVLIDDPRSLMLKVEDCHTGQVYTVARSSTSPVRERPTAAERHRQRYGCYATNDCGYLFGMPVRRGGMGR